MIKKYLPTVILTSLLTLLPILVGLILWKKLPDPMPSHFNAAGEPDGYLSRAAMVFGLPAGMLAAHLICVATTLMDPKKKNIDGKPFTLVLWIVPIVTLVVCGSVYVFALGYKFNMSVVAMLMCGVLFVLLGNYLPKCGHNYTIGIRTAWALNDEDNWRATHRFAGKVYVCLGLAIIVIALLSAKFPYLFWAMLVVTVLTAIIPVAYSYVYYLKHRGSSDQA